MPRKTVLISELLAISLVTASLFGCGGSGGNDASAGVTIKGVAAEGAAIANAKIAIRDVDGNSRTATTDDDGNFSFSTSGLRFPLMLKVAGASGTYYTLLTADDVDKRVNLTNFTRSIAQLALNAADDSALEASFSSGEFRSVSASKVAEAEEAFKKLMKQELGTIAGVTDTSPRTVVFVPASKNQDGDEVDRMLTLFKPQRGNSNSLLSLNGKPEFIRDIIVASYDGASDDLLTGGLGKTGLLAAAPGYADKANPTAAELRKNAIYNNYRAVIDASTASGFGSMYGPNVTKAGVEGEGKIAGKEYITYVGDSSGRRNVTLMVQIPTTFDKAKPCIVTGASSGSRGVYGAIGTAGEWGLKNGCAVAYTDKGTGTGLHTLNDDTVNLRNGLRATAAVAGKESLFTAALPGTTAAALNAQLPNRIAFKHAYSRENPEKDWGRSTLDAVAFAFYALNEEYGSGAAGQKARVITPANTTVIASSISNGGGAALLAAEQDRLGLIDGVAANEPQIQPRKPDGYTIQQAGAAVVAPGKPLYDYSSFAAIYQPCIAGNAGRCTSLVQKGLLTGSDLASQQADARKRLRDYGWTADSDAFQTALAAAASGAFAGFNANTNFLVTVTYANAYGRFTPADKVCGFTFAKTDGAGTPAALTAEERAQSFASQNGIIGNPVYEDSVGGAKAYAVGISPSTGRADQSLDGVLCLRSLMTGRDPVTNAALTGALAEQSSRVRAGVAEVLASGNLRGKPAVIVAGRSDHLVPVNHASRAYLGLNSTVEGAASKLRYVEVTNANHFDVFSSVVPATIVPMHVYLFRALDAVYANLNGSAALPASQVVRTVPRASATTTVTDANLPPIAISPAAENRIVTTGTIVNVPD
ncbi:D-(-)-3-hydroxybutyrate oligomer hydrolase [Noviherbaspirillum soli]|uniref:D-(-)-3-hydroxybutyrate oligomer hydrolase n=1 Tax=Noviherbaspirillum soli TaxID=1064518 RepID=UPI001E3A95F7|nr:D-(-)-3-hydroxybutyrate oligomer hydrolase [Noviherbaspirillum soli]